MNLQLFQLYVHTISGCKHLRAVDMVGEVKDKSAEGEGLTEQRGRPWVEGGQVHALRKGQVLLRPSG